MSPKKPNKERTGTEELALKNINIQIGCEHGCLYPCYAFSMRHRFDGMDYETWIHPQIQMQKVTKKYRLPKRTPADYDLADFMLASAHDITPLNIVHILTVIKTLVETGGKILIVSKAHADCFEQICQTFAHAKDQIEFMVTVGSKNNAILKRWDPGAPLFEERMRAFEIAHAAGFQASFILEPLLDEDPVPFIHEICALPARRVWIGSMNYSKAAPKIDHIRVWQLIHECYDHVKWKHSFRVRAKNVFPPMKDPLATAFVEAP